MKTWTLIFAIGFLGFNLAEGSQVSLSERIRAVEFYKKEFPVLFGHEACRRPETLLSEVKKLSQNQKKLARKFIK